MIFASMLTYFVTKRLLDANDGAGAGFAFLAACELAAELGILAHHL